MKTRIYYEIESDEFLWFFRYFLLLLLFLLKSRVLLHVIFALFCFTTRNARRMKRVLIFSSDDAWFTTKTFHLEFRLIPGYFVYDTYITFNVNAYATFFWCFTWIKHVVFLSFAVFFSMFFLFCHAHISPSSYSVFDLLTTRIGLVWFGFGCVWLQFILFAHIVHAIISKQYSGSSSHHICLDEISAPLNCRFPFFLHNFHLNETHHWHSSHFQMYLC